MTILRVFLLLVRQPPLRAMSSHTMGRKHPEMGVGSFFLGRYIRLRGTFNSSINFFLIKNSFVAALW